MKRPDRWARVTGWMLVPVVIIGAWVAAAVPKDAWPWGLGLSIALSYLLLRYATFLSTRRDHLVVLGSRPTPRSDRDILSEGPRVESLLGRLASGQYRNEGLETAGRPSAAAVEGLPVDATVFAPNVVGRGATGLVQVILHVPADREQAEKEARRFDATTTARGYRALSLAAPIGSVFSFALEIDDFTVVHRESTLLWTGSPQAASFHFEVPKRCKVGMHAATVWISLDEAPIGRIDFRIEVAREVGVFQHRPVGDEARRYRACFCSYSSLDRVETLKRTQGLRAAGLETFIDVLSLRPGDAWNPEIFDAIDRCDLFVLIWSANARKSKWVQKEARYALRRHGEPGAPDFRPIPIEGPPIPQVPRALKATHFNDATLYLIRAAELESRERKRNHALANAVKGER